MEWFWDKSVGLIASKKCWKKREEVKIPAGCNLLIKNAIDSESSLPLSIKALLIAELK